MDRTILRQDVFGICAPEALFAFAMFPRQPQAVGAISTERTYERRVTLLAGRNMTLGLRQTGPRYGGITGIANGKLWSPFPFIENHLAHQFSLATCIVRHDIANARHPNGLSVKHTKLSNGNETRVTRERRVADGLAPRRGLVFGHALAHALALRCRCPEIVGP